MQYIESSILDDEVAADVDEPPDSVCFSKITTPLSTGVSPDPNCFVSSQYRKASLLTRALLTSPELTAVSDIEVPVLTSDSGLTSPARIKTPSPSDLATAEAGLTIFPSTNHISLKSNASQACQQPPRVERLDQSQETKVEEGLGRRRCISFACGKQGLVSQAQEDPAAIGECAEKGTASKIDAPSKRPCMLRFSCPVKPVRNEPLKAPVQDPPAEADLACPLFQRLEDTQHERTGWESNDETSSLDPARSLNQRVPVVFHKIPTAPSLESIPRSRAFNRVNYQKSEATRFHEFAGSFDEEDEWVNEQTAFRHKITINDTLRKENAIRRLGEEAEEEGLDEDGEYKRVTYNGTDMEDYQEDASSEPHSSDDGNESDDEEGFAESDDESNGDSEYHFWTPGLTTAATSTDHIEHIRPSSHRTLSESSLESMRGASRDKAKLQAFDSRSALPRNYHIAPQWPGTPALPDSSDFVIGTIDEDRPLEDAYVSCMEKRKRSKQKLIPQDIDPSFPTSDPEHDDVDDENGEVEDPAEDASDVDRGFRPDSKVRIESRSISCCSEAPDHHPPTVIISKRIEETTITPLSSPRCPQSPAPCRLFGQATHRLRSPPPLHRRLRSPPSSRRPSFTGPSMPKTFGVDVPRLAQRPNPLHTTSLPRTPNPFWGHARRSHLGKDSPFTGTSPKSTEKTLAETRSRGPIDIIQGLAHRRQRRKEKLWRQQCRMAHAGKETHRRCAQGKGAERMRELGLEVADRFRAYGQRTNLVLSV